MTFLGLEARTDLPKVSYPTALDFFVFLSFAFIFATILQYAFVHYFTKYGSGECYYDFWDDSDDSDTDENFSRISSLTQIDSADAYGVIPLSRLEIKITQERSTARLWRSFKSFFMKNILCYATKDMQNYDEDNFGNSQQIVDLTLSRCEPSSSGASTNTLNTPQTRKSSISTGRRIINRDRRNLRRNFNSVSKIDKFSRVAFPFLFFFINVIYWIFYLSRSQRK
jgi:gamma-aminobutyric acid receptor subunit alpha